MSSSQKSHVAFVGFGEVVIRIFGGRQGSEVGEQYRSKGSGSSEVAARSGRVEGSSSRVLSSVRGTFLARRS
jgi:hypothetical protein